MSAAASKKPGRTCPTCGKPTIDAFRPFCSAKCKNVDLHRWISEAYRVPAGENDRKAADFDAPSEEEKPE